MHTCGNAHVNLCIYYRGNEMNYLNELPILIVERVKIALGPEGLLKIDNDKLMRSIVLDAAGHVTGILLDRIRNGNNVHFDSHDTATLQDVISDISKKLFEKALDDATISHVIAILKEEQDLLSQQVENTKI